MNNEKPTNEGEKGVSIGSHWTHYNGIIYKVIALANTRSDRTDEYPIIVVYENTHDNSVYCRELDDWHTSMIPLEGEK